MQSHNRLEEQFSHMWCIRCLPAKNKVGHLEESINCHEDRIYSLLCARKSQHEIHAQVFPTIFWSGQRCIQAHILSLSFSNWINQTTPHNCRHNLPQLGSIIFFFETCRCLVSLKMLKSASMRVSNKFVSQQSP